MADQELIYPSDSDCGYAATLDGKVSLRTASFRREAAMINALVLWCGVDAHLTGNWSDDRIRQIFADAQAKAPGRLKIVEVICLATKPEPTGPDVLSFPALSAITDGLVIKRPEPESMAPPLGDWGSLTYGPSHVPGAGPVILIGLHHPDGTTLLGTLGLEAYRSLGFGLNDAAIRVMAGEFDKPETAQ